jgi:Flp pilus assembly pilin Flp
VVTGRHCAMEKENLMTTITTALTRTAAAVHAAIISLLAFLLAPSMDFARVPARSRRGATFIEYALLAAIAVAIFLVAGPFLINIFNTILGRVQSGVNG